MLCWGVAPPHTTVLWEHCCRSLALLFHRNHTPLLIPCTRAAGPAPHHRPHTLPSINKDARSSHARHGQHRVPSSPDLLRQPRTHPALTPAGPLSLRWTSCCSPASVWGRASFQLPPINYQLKNFVGGSEAIITAIKTQIIEHTLPRLLAHRGV